MNKYRRKEIDDLIQEAESLKDKIEEILSEEQDYFDNMPENLQFSERGENSQQAINDLEEAQSSIEDCISYLEGAREN